MPVITVALRPGRTIEQKRELIDRLTTAFVETCGGTREGVWIQLQDTPAHDWGIGGDLQSDLLGETSPSEVLNSSRTGSSGRARP